MSPAVPIADEQLSKNLTQLDITPKSNSKQHPDPNTLVSSKASEDHENDNEENEEDDEVAGQADSTCKCLIFLIFAIYKTVETDISINCFHSQYIYAHLYCRS